MTDATSPSASGAGTPPPSPYGIGIYGMPGATPYGGMDTGGHNLTEVGLFRLLRLLRRKWLTILLMAVLGLSGAWYKLSVTPKSYQASSTVEMRTRRPRFFGREDAVIDDSSRTWQTEQLFNTRLQRFMGGTMRKRVLQSLREEGVADLEALPSASFSLIRDTHLVRITCMHGDPAWAMRGANAYANEAIKWSLEENKRASEEAVEWLHAQAVQQRKVVERAESALVEFRTEHNLDLVESRRLTAERAIVTLSEQITATQAELALARETLTAILSPGDDLSGIDKLPPGIPLASEIRQKYDAWKTAVLEHRTLLLRLRPEHPQVQAAVDRVDALRRQVNDSVVGARTAIAAKIALLEQQIATLAQSVAAERATMGELALHIAQANAKLSALEREQQAADVSYRGLLNRIEEARLSADQNTATVSLIEPANLPRRPVSPRPPRILAFGLFIGLGAGIGLALLKEMLDDQIASTVDVEQTLGLPVLGIIPHTDAASRKAMVSDANPHLSEAFATLRSVLVSPQYRDHSTSLIITSSAPEDGKTTTACNLAITYAQASARVLLVDFDLRRPQVAGVFGITEQARSLGHALAQGAPGDADFAALAHQLPAYPGLDVIATRADPELPVARLMASTQVRRFVEWARGRYDQVILDTPHTDYSPTPRFWPGWWAAC